LFSARFLLREWRVGGFVRPGRRVRRSLFDIVNMTARTALRWTPQGPDGEASPAGPGRPAGCPAGHGVVRSESIPPVLPLDMGSIGWNAGRRSGRGGVCGFTHPAH